ncbi:flavoprotein [Streptomyces sp. NPDC057291]|uniref:flavoprotein n=1 Tax=Streptomyces sp. NPDC057291 TaxID=3346087 RepID=UPI00363C6212
MLLLSAADVRLPVDANYRHDGEVCRPGNTGCRDQPRLLVVSVVVLLLCCTAGSGDGPIWGGGTVSSGGLGVLGVVGTAADGVETLRTGLVEPAMALGWQVAVTLTPNAGRWLRANGEFDRLEALTGLPVRDAPRLPTEPRPHPVADCYVVAPASANYVAKLAMGVADNQALTQVSEALGTIGVPVVLFPRVNAAHARHPAWQGRIEALRKADVDLVYGPDVWPLYEPREDPAVRELPWPTIIESIQQVATESARHPL